MERFSRLSRKRVILFLLFIFVNRLQCTTKGTKALRLLGDGGMNKNPNIGFNQPNGGKESALAKLAARANAQRRLLLKNGEVNISR